MYFIQFFWDILLVENPKGILYQVQYIRKYILKGGLKKSLPEYDLKNKFSHYKILHFDE